MKKDRREARNLICVLSSATFLAFLVVVGLVYYFGSSGTYVLRNVLISPESLAKTSLIDYAIEFCPPGSGRHVVTLQNYTEFYHALSLERSLLKVTDEMERPFKGVTSTLTLFFYPPHHEMIIQQAQFLEGSELFRVQPLSEEEWLYFRCPGVYERVVGLFK